MTTQVLIDVISHLKNKYPIDSTRMFRRIMNSSFPEAQGLIYQWLKGSDKYLSEFTQQGTLADFARVLIPVFQTINIQRFIDYNEVWQISHRIVRAARGKVDLQLKLRNWTPAAKDWLYEFALRELPEDTDQISTITRDKLFTQVKSALQNPPTLLLLTSRSYDPPRHRFAFDNVPLAERYSYQNDEEIDVYESLPEDFTADRYCLSTYESDPVTLESLDDLDPSELYVDSTKKCFHIPGLLDRWESAFSLYDPQSERIVPSYPSDYSNEPIPPRIVREIVAVADDRGLWSGSRFPLLQILLRHRNMLENLYDFIHEYRYLVRSFDQVASSVPSTDNGFYYRRDQLAADMLNQIAVHNGLVRTGAYKYFIPRPVSGINGTQVFYQCLLTTLFSSSGYQPELSLDGRITNVQWVLGRCDSINCHCFSEVYQWV